MPEEFPRGRAGVVVGLVVPATIADPVAAASLEDVQQRIRLLGLLHRLVGRLVCTHITLTGQRSTATPLCGASGVPTTPALLSRQLSL